MPQNEEKGKVLKTWTVPEYRKYERTFSWFLGMAVVVGLLLLYAVYSSNFLFALIIIMVLAVILLNHFRDPQDVEVSIAEKGLQVDNKFYGYEGLKNFWIVNDDDVKELYFSTSNVLMPQLKVAVSAGDVEEVRGILKKKVKEDANGDEPVSELWGRVLKI